jgi:hypothetical protein
MSPTFVSHTRIDGFTEHQPYHLVLVGEKSSLRPVLSGVADRYHADLYLPTGEISDTQAYMMARSAVRDGRPMVVFYFADCDPSGWQMPISLTRKLQGLKAIEFEGLDFQIHPVGLTPDQVRLYGLPSTPLKDTERRADKWKAAKGVEQTEVDSIAATVQWFQRQLRGRRGHHAQPPLRGHEVGATPQNPKKVARLIATRTPG